MLEQGPAATGKAAISEQESQKEIVPKPTEKRELNHCI